MFFFHSQQFRNFSCSCCPSLKSLIKRLFLKRFPYGGTNYLHPDFDNSYVFKFICYTLQIKKKKNDSIFDVLFYLKKNCLILTNLYIKSSISSTLLYMIGQYLSVLIIVQFIKLTANINVHIQQSR